MKFLEHLKAGLTYFDGAMGTQLMARGLGPGQAPESWNLSHPQQVLAIHRDYLAAGCQVISSNTFGAHPLKWENAPQLVQAGLSIARQAVDGWEGPAWVALDMGPTGRLMRPFGDLDFESAYRSFAGMVQAGRDQADLILIETLSDLFEAKAAILAAKENADLPVVVTLSLDEKGMLLTGGDIPALVALLEGLGVDALGLNCGLGPAEMLKLLPQLYEIASLPIVLCPNAGLPVSVDGKAVYKLSPQDFALAMEQLLRGGARGLGGCCGTTPEHLRQCVARTQHESPLPVHSRRRGWVSSYARAVDLAQGPYLVGERLNPTGKPRMKEALKNQDMDYLLLEAVRQVEAGAAILDVNVGLPGIDEAQAMAQAVQALQGVVDAPLQLDSADPQALERGLRLYAGCALINSVNGKPESMARVFPLAQKYGACVVALTLDESGIPPTAQGRLEVARRIIQEAGRYGIGPERIAVDPLCLAVSAVEGGAQATLEALAQLRAMGVATNLGVSNVSFGLPQRPRMNAAFLAMALCQGLDLAIVNPLSADMMDAWFTAQALLGRDAGCAGYIARFAQDAPEKRTIPDSAPSGQAAPGGGAVPGQAPAAGGAAGSKGGIQGDMSLEEAVVRGLKGQAAALAKEMLAHMAPMDIINQGLVPALDRVGAAFEQGKMFLPQLLMSADAASAGFEALKAALAQQGTGAQDQGKVVLATVQGDIHDIGKNIVKALLENYGFQVIDLGRDVPPERVVQAAKEQGARLVGLSALMTTTLEAMGQTIRQLRQAGDFQVVVGGAVLTPDFAQQLGADCYARDAMQTVRYAQQVYQGAP
ncbi:MAG TPA: homocysteine S-methyltransferase family protein [Candidatus Excrementavichristensenella intestinipullorum]|nr:homocysteine S-methyltransferase family protein [Candidatus Excrementavichristensenella intestinipullorum]